MSDKIVASGGKKPKKLQQKKQAKTDILNKRKTLAKLVQQRPLIWNLNEPLHSRPDAVSAAWTQISSEMGCSGTNQ